MSTQARPSGQAFNFEDILDITQKRSNVLGKPDAIESIAILIAKADGLKDIASSLPAGSSTNPKRFLAGFIKCARLDAQNGKGNLAKCSMASILEALKLAAMVDVVPGDGRAYLIPYGTECKFELSAHGMRDVMRRSSDVLDINDQCVYEGDDFECVLEGPERGIRHQRKSFGAGRKWIATYVTVLLKHDPRPIVEILDEVDLAAIKSQSKNAGGLPWGKFVDEHSRAKVIRRVSKRVPMRPDDDAALQAIDAANFLMSEAAAANERQYREEPMRVSIDPSAVKASDSPNRGHDATEPAKAEPKAEPTEQELDSLFAQQERVDGAGTAAALK